MKHAYCLAVVALAAVTVLAAQDRPPSSNQPLARAIFKELIEINTTDSRATCTKASEAMAARLRAAGFAAERRPGRRADGEEAQPRRAPARHGPRQAHPAHRATWTSSRRGASDWSFDPFVFLERDGYFYGRGTSDIKDGDAVLVTDLIRLKQENFTPDRDLIVALTADEEGGTANGVDWLLQNRRDLIDAEYCLNVDGGGGELRQVERSPNELQTSEKVYLSFVLETRNKGGHSSLPVKDNAIYHLAEGLSRLAAFEFPVRLNDTTRAFFERMAGVETGAVAADMKAVAGAPPDAAAAARLSAGSPVLQRADANDVRRHASRGRARGQRAAAVGPRDRQLPHAAGGFAAGGAGRRWSACWPIRPSR